MILVTGADGFIGSHLAEKLVREGHNVRALVQYNSHNSWGWLDSSPLSSEMEVIASDIRDPYAMSHLVRGCSKVLHLAALIGIPYSYNAPNSYIDTNIKGTLNLLNAARDFNVEKFVHTSTSEVYGTAKYVPMDENHSLIGQSPYSASKIGADQLSLSYVKSFYLSLSIIRPFNTYGPRQSARAVIPSIIVQLLNNKNIISLGKLSPTRDFNFVGDTVDGFIAALNATNDIGEVVNIGSNYEISIEDTAYLIADIMEKSIVIESDESRIRPDSSEVERLLCENSKAKKLYNWNPQFSGKDGLRSGLTLTIDWLKEPSNLALYKSNAYNI